MTFTVQPGDFCCVPIHGYVGKLISVGEWLNGDGFGDFDHAEIFIGEADDTAPFGYTIGAYPGGAAKIALSCAPEQLPNALWSSAASLGVTDDLRPVIVENAKKTLGIPYSFLDYLSLFLHRFKIPAPFLKSYIESSKHMICSQLVDFVYAESNIHLFKDDRWPGYVTPASLAKIIRENSYAG